MFGGALFSAGITTDLAQAQIGVSLLDLQQHDAYAFSRGAGGTIDTDGSIGTGSFSFVTSVPGEAASGWNANILGVNTGAYSSGLATAYAEGFVEFGVTADAFVAVIWDFGGHNFATAPALTTLEVFDVTNTTTLLVANASTTEPATGLAFLPVSSDTTYRWTVYVHASPGVDATTQGEFRLALRCDLNVNGQLTADDIGLFVDAFVGNLRLADIDHDNSLDADDIDAFVSCFLGG